MRELLGLLGLALLYSAQSASLPAPQIQNGRVEVRAGGAIDREISAIAKPNAADPAEVVWVAWRVPMIDGDRDLCSWYSDRLGTIRGIAVDEDAVTIGGGVIVGPGRPAITPPAGPIPLEAGTHLVILVRVVGGRVERLRTVGDDCPMDAGGRTVYWLSGISPTESLRYLRTIAAVTAVTASDRGPGDLERRVAASAVRAIGYHRESAADAALDELAASHPDTSVRRQATSTLASLRGAHGVLTIARLIGAAKNPDDRRTLTTTLGQSQDASVVGALRTLTQDTDARVRAEAINGLVLRGGAATIPEALKIIATDADDNVRRRAVSAIGRLPAEAGVASLIQLARTSIDPGVRKAAVSALSQSRDSRAVAFMEEVLKGR